MRNILVTIAVLLSVCANAQYKETLHATIGPTNKVVTSIPDWAKSDTPPSGGGSGGTSNYNDLINKPSINGITLTGNHTAQSLKLVYAEDVTGYLWYYDSYDNKYVPAVVERADYANFSANTEQFGGVYADDMTTLYYSTIPDMNQTISRIIAQIENVSATGSVVQIGVNSYVGSTNTIAIGNDSGAQGDLNSIPKAFASDEGETTYATVPVSALGAVAEGFQSLARGAGSVAIGSQASGYGSFSTSIGGKTYSHGNNSIAIGGNAYARGSGAIQIGSGRNESNNTFQVGSYRVLNEDGTIPPERITSLNNGSETRTADALFRSADNVNTLWSYVYGDTVWIAVTNYMRTISGVAPSFQLWEVRDGKTNCVYWSAEEIDTRVGDKIDVAVSNVAHNIATQKADRAWAKYQSMTGADNPAPNEVTIISTPSVMLSGGYEWQRYVESANEVWVLKCNDLVTLGADTSAYFRITDLEGETQFAIEKTASRLVDAVPTKTGFSGDYFEVTFEGNIQPTIYVSLDLVNSAFIECNGTENEYGLSCSWTQDASANTYTATITHNSAEGKPSKMFVYGKVLQQGSTVVKHTAPSSFDGGIIINGIRYQVGTAIINGSTVLTLTNGQAVSE